MKNVIMLLIFSSLTSPNIVKLKHHAQSVTKLNLFQRINWSMNFPLLWLLRLTNRCPSSLYNNNCVWLCLQPCKSCTLMLTAIISFLDILGIHSSIILPDYITNEMLLRLICFNSRYSDIKQITYQISSMDRLTNSRTVEETDGRSDRIDTV